MPQINIHQQEIGIRSTPSGPMAEDNITPKIADTTAVGEALFKTGAATSEFANSIIKAKTVADTAAAKLNYSTAMTEHLAEGKKLTDLDEIEAHKEKGAKIKQSIEERYPNVAGALRPWMDHGERIANVDLDNHLWKVTIDDIRAKNMAYVEDLNKKIAYSNPEQAEEYRIERDAYLDNISEVGAENRTTTERLKLEGNVKAELYKVDELIRNDATTAKMDLLEKNDDGSFKNFGYLTADLRGKLIGEADQRDRFNKNEFFTLQHRKQEENRQAIWTAFDKGTPDPELIAMIDRAMQPDSTGTIGLPAHEGFDLKEKIRNGTLKDTKTDYGTWDNLYTRIQKGEDASGDIGRAVSRGSLSVQDAKGLRSLIDKENSGLDKQTQKSLDLSLSVFKENIGAWKNEAGNDAFAKEAYQRVMSDAIQASQFVKSQKDMDWFTKHLDASQKALETGYSRDSLDKLKERNNEWYDKFMGEYGRTRRVGNIQTAAPGASPGVRNPTQYDSLVDQAFGKDAPTAKAIMKAENASMDPTIVNPAGGGVGAIGLFQIRGKLHEKALKDAGIIKTTEDLKDPGINIRAAKFLFDRDGWSPWNESKATWSKASNEGWKTINGKKYRQVG